MLQFNKLLLYLQQLGLLLFMNCKLLLYLQQVGLLLFTQGCVFTLLLFYIHQQQLLLFTQGSFHFQSVQYML